MNIGQAGMVEARKQAGFLLKDSGGRQNLLGGETMLMHLFNRDDSLPQVAVGGPIDGSHSTGADEAKNEVAAL
jgi:hypothetical protein